MNQRKELIFALLLLAIFATCILAIPLLAGRITGQLYEARVVRSIPTAHTPILAERDDLSSPWKLSNTGTVNSPVWSSTPGGSQGDVLYSSDVEWLGQFRQSASPAVGLCATFDNKGNLVGAVCSSPMRRR